MCVYLRACLRHAPRNEQRDGQSSVKRCRGPVAAAPMCPTAANTEKRRWAGRGRVRYLARQHSKSSKRGRSIVRASACVCVCPQEGAERTENRKGVVSRATGLKAGVLSVGTAPPLETTVVCCSISFPPRHIPLLFTLRTPEGEGGKGRRTPLHTPSRVREPVEYIYMYGQRCKSARLSDDSSGKVEASLARSLGESLTASPPRPPPNYKATPSASSSHMCLRSCVPLPG